MPLERRLAPQPKEQPASFRFGVDTVKQLRALAAFYNQSQVAILEKLIADAYKAAAKKDDHGELRPVVTRKPKRHR